MPREDYRDARDGRRREREAHLRQRRVTGESLAGGRSASLIPVGSTTGLAETTSIQLAAVNELTVIAQDDDVAMSGSYGDQEELLAVEVIGTGNPFLVIFTDEYDMTSFDVDDLISASYRVRITDNAGNTLTDAETGLGVQTDQTVFQALGPAFGYTDAFVKRAMTPTLVLLAYGLEEGLHYQVRVTFSRSRTDVVNDAISLTSSARRLIIQEVKR